MTNKTAVDAYDKIAEAQSELATAEFALDSFEGETHELELAARALTAAAQKIHTARQIIAALHIAKAQAGE